MSDGRAVRLVRSWYAAVPLNTGSPLRDGQMVVVCHQYDAEAYVTAYDLKVSTY